MDLQKNYDTTILKRFLSNAEIADIQAIYNRARTSRGGRPRTGVNRVFRGDVLSKALGQRKMELLHNRYQLEKSHEDNITYGISTNPYNKYGSVRELNFSKEAEITNFLWKALTLISWIITLMVLL